MGPKLGACVTVRDCTRIPEVISDLSDVNGSLLHDDISFSRALHRMDRQGHIDCTGQVRDFELGMPHWVKLTGRY